MSDFKELFQGADWKKEKHVPVIEAADKTKRGVLFSVGVSVGKEISHPNTTVHHIRWIAVYFLPKGETFPYQIGKFEFTSHGESVQGADTSSVYTHPEVVMKFKTDKPGLLLASSYCNIHGLWQNAKEIEIE
jgi:superoxide reductase